MPTAVPGKSSWSVRPRRLATLFTVLVSHALACNGLNLHVLHRGWVTFGEYFGWKGTIPSNPSWSGKTRDISVSYGVEILTETILSSQYMHLTDRQMYSVYNIRTLIVVVVERTD